jgi:UDP-N-acetylmuramyl pentapeptide synthase
MKADKIMIFDDKMALALYLREKLTERDVVLVKGSRSMKMEDVVQRLIS